MFKKIISLISFIVLMFAALASFQTINTNAFFPGSSLTLKPAQIPGGLPGTLNPNITYGDYINPAIPYYFSTDLWGATYVTGNDYIPSHPTNPDSNWEINHVAKMDNDNYLDLVWKNKVNGGVVIWYLNGQGYFKSGNLLNNVQPGDATFVGTADTYFRVVASGFSNGDANKDIIFRNVFSGTNIIWYLGATGSFIGGVAAPTVSGVNWKLATTADANEDGISDFIWQANGSFVVWYMNLAGSYSAGCQFSNYNNQNQYWRIYSSKETRLGSANGITLNFDLNGEYAGAWYLRPNASNNCLVFNSGSTVLSPANIGVDYNLNAAASL